MKPFSPMWMRFDWVLALAIGVTLGLGLGSMRNASSDERMYRTVVAAASIPIYQQYLARGGRHADEVRDVLLARAELQEAQRQGSVGALEAFARAHPSSKIAPEIDAAIRRAFLIEFDKSKAVGTVAALDDFAKKYPDGHLEAELDSTRHGIYAQALASWKKKSRVDAATSAFIERLLAAAEKAGPACEVRFRFKPTKPLDEVDKRITKHAYYPGPDALPSHYVTPEALHTREQRVAQALADGFAASFPTDLLSVRAGEPLAADAPVPAGAPVLVIDYSGTWSNAFTASPKPRTVFGAIRFDFRRAVRSSGRGAAAARLQGVAGCRPMESQGRDDARRVSPQSLRRHDGPRVRRLAQATDRHATAVTGRPPRAHRTVGQP